MLHKKSFVYTGVFVILSLVASHGRLAKEKAMGDGSSSDFSYDSRYAHRNDGAVNLLTGRASSHMNLTSISSKTGLTYNINLDYFGIGAKQIYSNNEIAPTGIVGLGWNLSFSTIFVQFNGTLDLAKHEYFLKDEDGSISEIKRDGNSPSTYTFRIKNHPTWKMTAEWDLIGDVSWVFRDRVIGWKIVKPDGTIIRYGKGESTAQRYLPRGQNDFDPMGSQNIFYQWDVASIEDVNGSKLQFEYDQAFGLSASTDNTTMQSTYTTGKLSREPRNGGCPACEEEHGPDAYSGYITTCKLEDWFAVRYICKCFWPVHDVHYWHYVSYSYPSKILSDRGDIINFTWTPKASSEVGNFLSDDPKCLHEIEYCLAGQSTGNGIQKIKFTYSGYPNEVPPVNADAGFPKRLLTGITSTQGTGVLNRRFEYGQSGSDFALLTKNIEPMTGKSTIFKYLTHSITNQSNGKSYNVDVVKQIIHLDGLKSNPGIVLSYSYTDVASKQDFDEGSGIPYWGMVTESNSATGSVVTEFDLNKNTQKFGERTSVKNYGTTGELVSTETYDYGLEAFGTAPNQWYTPILTKTTKTEDGIISTSGTTLCAIDPNNGLANLSWTKNSDGKYLVTKRKYVYEVHPTEMGAAGTNQLSQVASTKIYQFSSYNPTVEPGACNLSTGVVIKATYTTWSGNSAGQWRPSATYAWNTPMDNQGLPTTTFYDFDESQPTAHSWQLTGKIDKYDDFGNVLQASNATGTSSATIYGTPSNLPVATITNSKYGECYFTSFEEDQNWNFNVGGSKPMPRSEVYKKNGRYSALLDNSNSTELVAESQWRTLDQGLPTAKKYTFSGWIYTTGPSAKIHFFTSVESKAVETFHYTYLETPVDAANKWVFLQGNFEAPVGAKYFMIRIKNSGITGGNSNTKSYFDDLKFYPSSALMTTTYYDPKWLTPILSVDANENPSQLLTLDSYGRPAYTYKVNKDLSSSDATGLTLLSKKEYHLMGKDLRLLTPNGGEDLIPGQQYSIAWSGPSTIGTDGVDLLYYNGTTWNPITGASKLKNQNSFLWNVPTNATGCKIKVQEDGNTTNFDESDAVFNISDYLSILTPSKDETWYAGRNWASTYTITWNYTGGSVTNVHLEYFDGSNWITITPSTVNDGSFDWVPVGFKMGAGLTRLRISEAGTGKFAKVSEPFNLYFNSGMIRRLGWM